MPSEFKCITQKSQENTSVYSSPFAFRYIYFKYVFYFTWLIWNSCIFKIQYLVSIMTEYKYDIMTEFVMDNIFQDWIQTCSNGTLLARSFIKSLALMIAYGSKVFLVVVTVMLPSIRSRAAFTYCNIEKKHQINLIIQLWQWAVNRMTHRACRSILQNFLRDF